VGVVGGWHVKVADDKNKTKQKEKRNKKSTIAKLTRTNYPTKAHTILTYRFIEHHILKY
jgi:hypothetical protein